MDKSCFMTSFVCALLKKSCLTALMSPVHKYLPVLLPLIISLQFQTIKLSVTLVISASSSLSLLLPTYTQIHTDTNVCIFNHSNCSIFLPNQPSFSIVIFQHQ